MPVIDNIRSEIEKLDNEIVWCILQRIKLSQVLIKNHKCTLQDIFKQNIFDRITDKVKELTLEEDKKYEGSNIYLLYRIFDIINETTKKRQFKILNGTD